MNQHTHELEKNALMELADKKLGHLKPHVGKIIMGGVLLTLLAFGVIYYFYLQEQIKGDQWRQLNMAMYGMQATGNTNDFDVITENFPDTKVSHAGMLIAGDAHLRQGLHRLISDRNAAIKELQKAKASFKYIVESKSKPESDLENRTLYSLAYTCESLGEFDEAVTFYKQLITKAPNSPFAKQANRALDRLDDPIIRQVFEQFKTVGNAPGASLPKRPDISFPDLSAPAEQKPEGNPPADPALNQNEKTDAAPEAKSGEGAKSDEKKTEAGGG